LTRSTALKKRALRPRRITSRVMAIARWLLPVPVEPASQCRVSGV
jgi:hypothetical protein